MKFLLGLLLLSPSLRDSREFNRPIRCQPSCKYSTVIPSPNHVRFVKEEEIAFTDYVTRGVFEKDGSGNIIRCKGILNGKEIWQMVRISLSLN